MTANELEENTYLLKNKARRGEISPEEAKKLIRQLGEVADDPNKGYLVRQTAAGTLRALGIICLPVSGGSE